MKNLSLITNKNIVSLHKVMVYPPFNDVIPPEGFGSLLNASVGYCM